LWQDFRRSFPASITLRRRQRIEDEESLTEYRSQFSAMEADLKRLGCEPGRRKKQKKRRKISRKKRKIYPGRKMN